MADNARTLTANFVADTSGFSPKVNELIQRLKTLNQDFEQNKSKVNELNAKLKEYEKELKQLNSATNNGATANREQQQRMQQLRDSIAACNTQIGTYRAAQTNLRSQINSTNRELTEQQQAFNGVNSSAATFGDVLKANLASSAIQAGLQKTLNLLRQAAAYCYQVGSSFEASMSQVAAVSGASASELERLTTKAKELGASTKFTATETAEAFNYMAMAGWKTEEMLDGIDGVLNLAAASGTDLATTSDIVTDALTAFGLKAKDCAHFADILAAASANANTNVSMMGETFKYCAPVAGALGFSAEDVAVGVGLMANSGIKATQAGTAMRTVMTALAKDVKITGEAIGEVTVRTTNADGSMREFSDILTDLREVFSQLTESERSTVAQSIAGKNAMSGFLALMNAGEADVQKLTSAIANCDGAAANMAETMQDNLQGAVTKFNSALEGVGIAVFDKFKDGLTDTVNIFTEAMSDLTDDIEVGGLGESMESLADSFKSAAREIALIVKNELPSFINGLTNVINFVITFRKEIASAVTGFVAFKATMAIGNVVSAAISSIKAFVTAVKTATTAQKAFTAASAATPWGAIAAGVGLVVSALVDIASHANDAAEQLERLRQESDEAAASAQKYADKANALKDIKKRYEEIYNSEKPAAEKADELQKLQDLLISQFPELASQIDLVTGAYERMTGAIQGAIDQQNKYSKDERELAVQDAEAVEQNSSYKADWQKIKDPLNDEQELELYKKLVTLPTFSGSVALGNINFSGTYEDRERDLNELLAWMRANEMFGTSAYKEILRLAEQATADAAELAEKRRLFEEAVNPSKPKRKLIGMSDWMDDGDPYDERKDETQSDDWIKKLTREEREKLYKEDKQLADDMYSVGEISAEEYYKKLVELRDTYLDEGTHEWYQATAQIQSAYAKTADGIAEAAAKSSNKVKNSLDEVQMAYKKTLAAIDAEIERHNREKSDIAFQAKIDEIDEQLAYGRLDDFSKYELEKERQRLIDEHDEELYSRSAADAKAIVKDVYEAKTTLDKADLGTREYTLALGDYTDALGDLTEVMRGVGVALGVQNTGDSSVSNIDESTKNIYTNVILQAVNKSNSQLLDEFIKALSSKL